jgi:hypothetical protein
MTMIQCLVVLLIVEIAVIAHEAADRLDHATLTQFARCEPQRSTGWALNPAPRVRSIHYATFFRPRRPS